MTTVKVRVSASLVQGDASLIANTATWVLNRKGKKCIVSSPHVVGALLAQAKERGVTIRFYAVERFDKVPLDLEGVKRVLGGGKAVVELERPGDG